MENIVSNRSVEDMTMESGAILKISGPGSETLDCVLLDKVEHGLLVAPLSSEAHAGEYDVILISRTGSVEVWNQLIVGEAQVCAKTGSLTETEINWLRTACQDVYRRPLPSYIPTGPLIEDSDDPRTGIQERSARRVLNFWHPALIQDRFR